MTPSASSPKPSSAQETGTGLSAALHSLGSGAPSTGMASDAAVNRTAERAGFTASELLQVISRYDTGIIRGVLELPRGSTRAPKVILKTERGPMLLKRRAAGRSNPARITFTHGLHRHLETHNYPVPRLLGTARDRTPSVQLGDRIYELFEFVPGQAFDQSQEAAHQAGDALALLHRFAAGYSPSWRPAGGGFHDQPLILESLGKLPEKLGAAGSPEGKEAIERLHDAYDEARQRANESGIHAWPTQVIHGDWHPGNLLFADTRVIAVLDFDTARIASRAEDLASGALQFSLIRGERHEPASWPDQADIGRFCAFCRGYDAVPGCRISVAELKALPWLMVESLITEAVVPIAATGSFARMEGSTFLRMIDRKVQWLRQHADELREALDEPELHEHD